MGFLPHQHPTSGQAATIQVFSSTKIVRSGFMFSMAKEEEKKKNTKTIFIPLGLLPASHPAGADVFLSVLEPCGGGPDHRQLRYLTLYSVDLFHFFSTNLSSRGKDISLAGGIECKGQIGTTSTGAHLCDRSSLSLCSIYIRWAPIQMRKQKMRCGGRSQRDAGKGRRRRRRWKRK